jgi:hypothetical protein
MRHSVDTEDLDGGGMTMSDAEREEAIATIEDVVMEVFMEVLDLDGVASDDSFFELGGNSQKAIQTVRKLQEQFTGDLTVADLIESSSAEGLAKTIYDYLEDAAD